MQVPSLYQSGLHFEPVTLRVSSGQPVEQREKETVTLPLLDVTQLVPDHRRRGRAAGEEHDPNADSTARVSALWQPGGNDQAGTVVEMCSGRKRRVPHRKRREDPHRCAVT